MLAALSLLAIAFVFVLWPGLKNNQGRTPRIACVNNLKQIGLAMNLYANDHGERFPWQVARADGGTAEFAESASVLLHYLATSNELSTPKILRCPSDRQRTRVEDFAKLGTMNVSYFLSMDARSNTPQALLSGDRNISGGATNGFLRVFTNPKSAGWTPEMHETGGNVGFADGSVSQVTPSRLVVAMSNSLQVVSRVRLAMP